MKVSEETKKAFFSKESDKQIRLYFPELDLTVSNLYIRNESMELEEKIFDKESIEFVGCYATVFSIQVYDLGADIKGTLIEAYMTANGTEEIPLFHGMVDSAKMQSNQGYKKIVAYDRLYDAGNKDVATWYRSLIFPIALKDLRDSLFEYIGVSQKAVDLPNDNMQIQKVYDPKQLKALNVIRSICQINGVFGQIGRDGAFRYISLRQTQGITAFPSKMLFPSEMLFPAAGSLAATPESGEEIGIYRKIDYEEFQVRPVDRLTVRQSDEESGASFGSGQNNYIIQGNMFTYGMSEQELGLIAEAIYPKVSDIFYYPFTSDNPGLPYLECGDIVSFLIDSKMVSFYILNRRIKGIQYLEEAYSAKGTQFQQVFLTDLNVKVDLLKQDIKETVRNVVAEQTYARSDIDSKFEEVAASQLKIVSMPPPAPAPEEQEANTIYLIQGEVIIN